MADKTYDPQRDVYIDSENRVYVKNEYEPSKPFYVDISTEKWSVVRHGINNSLDFSRLNHFPSGMKHALKSLLKIKLRRTSGVMLNQYGLLLKKLNLEIPRFKWHSWGDISIAELRAIWDKLPFSQKSTLRRIYNGLAEENLGGAKPLIANEIDKWRTRKKVVVLRVVREWDNQRGSLTSAESELLRQALYYSALQDTLKQRTARVCTWIIFETFKRNSQVTSMALDALKKVEKQYYLEMPGVKAQAGRHAKWWPISEQLANEIESYSKIPEVKCLQDKYNRLIVLDAHSMHKYGHISSGLLGSAIFKYVQSLKVISPRTKDNLKVTPKRIRHTGGTKFAEHGFSRDIIADILEHDSYESADAYLDAIGADLIPAVERSDRKLGKLFSELSNVFFKGRVTSKPDLKVTPPPIFIPDFEKCPAVVGGCARNTIKFGKCTRHPFFGCYDGCPSFLAWKDADHSKALQYVQEEYERWNAVQGHKDYWKAKTEYERIYKAIDEVIKQCRLSKGNLT